MRGDAGDGGPSGPVHAGGGMKITHKTEGWVITVTRPRPKNQWEDGAVWIAFADNGVVSRAFVLDRAAAQALWEAFNALLTAKQESPFLIEEHAP